MHERIRDAFQDMVDHARTAQGLMEGRGLDDLLEDRMRRLALERVLEIVGEAASRVPDFVRRDLDLPWRQIVGLRNGLIHAYQDTDPATLVGVVEDHLPEMVEAVEVYLAKHG